MYKKVLKSLFVVSILCSLGAACPCSAMTYTEAAASSKPMAILIYAPWVDDLTSVTQNFGNMEARYGGRYNFVRVDLADKEAKAFNQKYTIYPNVPYVLLFKKDGRVSRYIEQSCILDDSCFSKKLDFFYDGK